MSVLFMFLVFGLGVNGEGVDFRANGTDAVDGSVSWSYEVPGGAGEVAPVSVVEDNGGPVVPVPVQHCAAPDDPEVFFQVFISCLESPEAPQVAASAGRGPVVVSGSEASRLLVGGSGLSRQPPGGKARLDMPVIAYTSDAARVVETEVGGRRVTVRAAPVSYAWGWGDGSQTTTTDPGAPWPGHTVFHYYSAPARGVVLTLGTTWSATFSVDGGPEQEVEGAVVTSERAQAFDVLEYTAVLTDAAEEAQGR